MSAELARRLIYAAMFFINNDPADGEEGPELYKELAEAVEAYENSPIQKLRTFGEYWVSQYGKRYTQCKGTAEAAWNAGRENALQEMSGLTSHARDGLTPCAECGAPTAEFLCKGCWRDLFAHP